jgi:4-hydroxybenzoate polyprenyltransferase
LPKVTDIERAQPREIARFRALLRALRPHQWVKNLLVFVPLLTAHRISELPQLRDAGLAFIATCAAVAAAYLVNDLLDLADDRTHPDKRSRPLANGDLPISWALAAILALIVAAALIALKLPQAFQWALLAYVASATFYSVRLKQVALVDVLVLAFLYTLRLILGAAAIGVPVSAWLLAFSAFFFLSLALLKRYVELRLRGGSGHGDTRFRGYFVTDAPLLMTMGVAAGYLSVLILALYITNPDATILYATPTWLWAWCPLIAYWLSSVWLAAWRGDVHTDPILYALRDKSTLAIAAGIAVAMLLAA